MHELLDLVKAIGTLALMFGGVIFIGAPLTGNWHDPRGSIDPAHKHDPKGR